MIVGMFWSLACLNVDVFSALQRFRSPGSALLPGSLCGNGSPPDLLLSLNFDRVWQSCLSQGEDNAHDLDIMSERGSCSMIWVFHTYSWYDFLGVSVSSDNSAVIHNVPIITLGPTSSGKTQCSHVVRLLVADLYTWKGWFPDPC